MRLRIPTIRHRATAVAVSRSRAPSRPGRVAGRVLDQTGGVASRRRRSIWSSTPRELTASTDGDGRVSIRRGARGHAPSSRSGSSTSACSGARVDVASGALGDRGRRADALAERRRHRHRHAHVPQRRRRREPGREPRRHRVGGQPGRHHRGAARGAADHARRRGPRDRAGHDRQPAQRRGQGQSVLPARLQPRSRHRLLDDRRRRAGEHADRRPRARLLRRQLPDSRARERRAVQEGAVLRRRGRLLGRRRRQHQLRQSARPPDRARQRRQRRLGPRCSAPPRRASAAATCSARSS